MKKNNFNRYYVLELIILLLLCLILLTGCGSDDNEKLKNKTQDEISYLERNIISMLNGFNNISYTNYKIEIKQEEQQSQGGNSQTEQITQEGQGSETVDGSENSGQGSNNQEQASQESGSDNLGSQNESQNQQQGNSNIIMVPNSILLNDDKDKINWDNMKYEVEKIYASWNTLFVDLNSLENENTKLLDFSSILNDTTKSIKQENKIDSMKNLSKLYSTLSEYNKNQTNDNKKINLIDTKSEILETYVAVTDKDWELAKKSLDKADQSFGNIINNISTNEINQSSINKSYVLIKELKKAINIKDEDIFFINYKNLMQELDNIK